MTARNAILKGTGYAIILGWLAATEIMPAVWPDVDSMKLGLIHFYAGLAGLFALGTIARRLD